MSTPFWLWAGGMSLVVVASLYFTIRRSVGRELAADSRNAENLSIYQQQLQELQEALSSGQLDGARFQELRVELDRKLLGDVAEDAEQANIETPDTRWTLAFLLIVPVLAILLYMQFGGQSQLRVQSLMMELGAMPEGEERDQAALRLVEALENQSERADPDGAYRYLLANYYVQNNRYAGAAAIFEELASEHPADGDIAGQYATALYMAAGRVFNPGVQSAVDHALTLDPHQPRLLGILGMDSFRRGDYQAAAEYWQRLLSGLPKDAEDADIIREALKMAQQRLSDTGVEVKSDSEAVSISVNVELGGDLVPVPQSTVFVFARAVDGPPMPLAVARFPVEDLPRQVVLDDSMAMTPAMRLSQFRKVEVIARVSASGTATASSGDFQGNAGVIELGAAGAPPALKIVIDHKLD